MPSVSETLPLEGAVQSGTATFRRINLALFCAGFVTFVTLYDVQPLLPVFASTFGVPPAVASLPLSVATAALAFGMLLAGALSETIGRKPLMVAALLCTSLLALATGFCTSFSSLLALRFFQGLVLAGVPSVAMAYLGEEMDARAIGGAMGLYINGNGLGGMSGRLGSSLLSDCVSWPVAIAIIGVVSLALTLVFALSLPPSARFRRKPFRADYVVSSLGQHLRDPGMLCLFALAFLAMWGFVSLYNYISFRLLAPPYTLSQSGVSLIFLVYLFGPLSSGLVGPLLNRFGRPTMLRATLGTMLVGVLVTLAGSLSLVIVGVALFTCGFFCAHAIASGWVGRRARTARAQASSLYLFCYYQGSSISGTLGGLFWQHYGWTGVAGMIATLTVAAFAVVTVLLRLTAAEAPMEIGIS